MAFRLRLPQLNQDNVSIKTVNPDLIGVSEFNTTTQHTPDAQSTATPDVQYNTAKHTIDTLFDMKFTPTFNGTPSNMNGSKSSVLYQKFNVDTLNYSKICVVPYDGEKYTLKNVYIVVSKPKGCTFRLIDKDNNELCEFTVVDDEESHIFNLDTFENLPTELDYLQLQSKIDTKGRMTIESIEFVMEY